MRQPRDLRALLKTKNITPRQLAQGAERSEDYIHRVLSRKQEPSGETARRMIRVSKGAFRMDDLILREKA